MMVNTNGKRKKNPEAYCITTYNNLKANLLNWGCPDFYRPITRIMYEGVFSSGTNDLGYISKEALANPKMRCKDHYLSPQFIGRMIMDNPSRFLKNYEDFKDIFFLARGVLNVTKKENTALSHLTYNNGTEYRVYVPTDKKYEHIGINLLSKVDRSASGWRTANVVQCSAADAYASPSIEFLLEYERDFLTTRPLTTTKEK